MAGAVRIIRGHKGRTATYIVAPSDADSRVKSQADLVADGVNDEVELLASITAAGTQRKSVKWMPGVYTLGAVLELPAIQDYFIDARGTTFGGYKGVQFDSVMDSWLYMGVITGPVTIVPTNPAPGDLLVTFCTSQLEMEDIVPGAGATSLTTDTTNGDVSRNRIYISGLNGGSVGMNIQEKANTVIQNEFSIGFIQDVDTAVILGGAGGTHVAGNKYIFGMVATNASGTGIQVYSNSEIFELRQLSSNILAGKGIEMFAGGNNNLITGDASLGTVGFSDSGTGNQFILPNVPTPSATISWAHMEQLLRARYGGRSQPLDTGAGWTQTTVGSGALALDARKIRAITGVTANSSALATVPMSGLAIGGGLNNLDWTKPLWIRFGYGALVTDAERVARVQIKAASTIGALADQGIELLDTNQVPSLETYGTSGASAATGVTLTDGAIHDIVILHLPAVGVYMYIDNALKASQTTAANFPSTLETTQSFWALSIANATGGGTTLYSYLISPEIWQGD